MQLPDYIRLIGVETFKKRHGVSESATRSYLTGYRNPRARKALEIARKSEGHVSVDEILGRTAKREASR